MEIKHATSIGEGTQFILISITPCLINQQAERADEAAIIAKFDNQQQVDTGTRTNSTRAGDSEGYSTGVLISNDLHSKAPTNSSIKINLPPFFQNIKLKASFVMGQTHSLTQPGRNV